MIKINIKERVKRYFFQNTTEKLRVRQIERVVKVPLPSAIRYAKELVNEHILKSEKIAGITLYSANRTSPQFILGKKLYNLVALEDSGIIDRIKEEYHNSPIIRFGSFARGEDIEESDIDLFVESPSKKKINLTQHEKKLKRKIQLFVYKNLEDIPNKDLRNNIINGMTLNGFVEVYK